MKRFLWPVLGIVLVLTFAVGLIDDRQGPPTTEQRSAMLADQVRCPTCAGLSSADSETPLAESVRDEIARRVAAGESDEQIRAYFVSVYGSEALMAPPTTGVSGLVWTLPLAGGVLAAVGVWLAVKRWQRRPAVTRTPTAEDEELVRRALEKR